MTSFIPLNIIPDSDSEAEVDNTEEIQIEDALKVYQRALRLHTDGAWEEAEKAYEDLFQLDIFQLDIYEEVHSQNRTIASSLPLVHYLAYKNHGAFKLDRLKNRIAETEPDDIRNEISQALDWYATALERDAGDSSLWRQTSQLALVLSSARLARFALESILDHNTVGADSSKDTLSLVAGGNHNPEDHLALLQLRGVLEHIFDTGALYHQNFYQLNQKKLNPRFTKCLNPLPWLSLPSSETSKKLDTELNEFSNLRQYINVPTRSWPAVGAALLQLLNSLTGPHKLEEEVLETAPVQIEFPLSDTDEDSRDSTPCDESLTESVIKSDIIMVDDVDGVSITDASGTQHGGLNDRRRSVSAARKRKSTSMGADNSRSRLSKRQRDKKEADAAAAAAAAASPESKHKVRQESQDEKLFNTMYDCLSSFGLSLGTAASLKIKLPQEYIGVSDIGIDSGVEKCELYIEDFKQILQTWDDDKGNVILYGDGIQTPSEAAQGMGLLDLEINMPCRPAFVGDDGLKAWVKNINARCLSINEVAFEWLKALCKRETQSSAKMKRSAPCMQYSSWMKHTWPEVLKSTVIRIACVCEETCYKYFQQFKEHVVLQRTYHSKPISEHDLANIEWAETLLELFLDDLIASDKARNIGESNADLDDDILGKKDRVMRWAYTVGDLIQLCTLGENQVLLENQLVLRYLWVHVVVTGLGDPSREFLIMCFEDMKNVLKPYMAIHLPNCHTMPEVSAACAEREISKLKTVDFFSTIFNASYETSKDNCAVIEVLEAILEPNEVLPYDEEEDRILQEIGTFFEGSGSMFKLHLWQKLKTAYEDIRNTPKILSCTLKCIEILMTELRNRSYIESAEGHRQFVLLRSLRVIETMVLSALEMMLSDHCAMDMFQKESEVVSALRSMMSLLRILHCYALWESSVLKSEVKASDLHSYRLVVVKFRDLLVRCWIMTYLLYSVLLRMGLRQGESEEVEQRKLEGKLADLLRDLHEELGARHYCKLVDHTFLKLIFEELLRFKNADLCGDLLQCIQCRFHLKLCSDQWYFFDHKTDPETLDRSTAIRLVDFVVSLASQKKVLQLPKSDLKIGLDKLVDVLGVPHRISNTRVFHNESVIDQYLKSSINPLRLFGCLKGELSLSTVTVGGYYNAIASKGLYFLQGKIALYPLRYQKKTGALKGDDLETAIQFFKYDVLCNADGWETWYRIAQTFEIQMEEAQTWSADAINTRRNDLVALERKTILSYMMAVSLAVRCVDKVHNIASMSEMYTDFGYRIYSASRPPMAMESFWMDGFDRHFSGRNGEGMYCTRPHTELGLETAHKFSLVLFEHAIAHGGQNNWKNHYMMGKCMGKLYNSLKFFSPELVLAKYVDAIRHCPEKTGNDYIFEPHHKLVSSTTKFVLNGNLEPQKACQILEASHFARKVDHVTDRESFVSYAIEVLRKMKAADKSKWHHRMTNRIAKLKFDYLQDVAGARSEFASLFSNKAAQLSIWKPEFERVGRHFVFASHYTMFYVLLLEKLNDRSTLEILAKRVRRLSNGLFRHADVWNHVFQAYITVLRRTGNVPEAHDDQIFNGVSFDDFTTHSQRLDIYCNLTDTRSSTLELLSEVFELRKLNSALTRNPAIDDLLADTYAKLYFELPEDTTRQITQDNENRSNPMSLKNLMVDSPPTEQTTVSQAPISATHSKVDDLPMRGKIAKITRREVISKASNLCKELNVSGTTAKSTSTITAPSSPQLKITRLNSPSGSAITGDLSGTVDEQLDGDVEMNIESADEGG